MKNIIIFSKISRKFRLKIVSLLKYKKWYPYIYYSYWHSFLDKIRKPRNNNFFISAQPNPGAGIGHQMANWIAGYWFAKQFGLPFAHIPFSSASWDRFLGFGENEPKVHDLTHNKNFKKVRLPLFKEDVEKEINLIKKIISSYGDRKVVFVCEQDQFYKDQHGISDVLKTKFYNAPAREDDKLIYSKENFNIAIHVRRGDIVAGQKNGNLNHQMRWQDNTYFIMVLKSVLESISPAKPVRVFLFSQGIDADFKEFEQFQNIHFCIDMSAQDSFLHMVYADLLISSKSSFSYKPALISNGIKVCPANFWHGYPSDNSFILVDDDGTFNKMQLQSLVQS